MMQNLQDNVFKISLKLKSGENRVATIAVWDR